jgi:hypothetical protein
MAATVTKTIVTIASTDTEYQIPGDYTPASIQRNYANDIPNIGSMQFEERVVTQDGETVREITFKPRTGTKGAGVTKTIVTIASTDTEYQIPGDYTPASIQRNYANDIPNIGSMQFEERVVTQDGETVREITFKPRTGTKG